MKHEQITKENGVIVSRDIQRFRTDRYGRKVQISDEKYFYGKSGHVVDFSHILHNPEWLESKP